VTFSKCSNLRTDIRSKIVELLDRRNIQHSSVDLVRFSWVEENKDDDDDEDKDDKENGEDKDDDDDDENEDDKDDEDDKENKDDEENEDDEENKDDEESEDDKDDEDIYFKVAPYGTVFATPVTIRVRGIPDSLTCEVAFHSSYDILDLLKEHGISDVDVAWSTAEYYYDQLLDGRSITRLLQYSMKALAFAIPESRQVHQ